MAVILAEAIVLKAPRVVNVTVERSYDEGTALYEPNVHVTMFTEVETDQGTHYNHETYDLDGDTATGVNLVTAAIQAHYTIVYNEAPTDPLGLYTDAPGTPPIVS